MQTWAARFGFSGFGGLLFFVQSLFQGNGKLVGATRTLGSAANAFESFCRIFGIHSHAKACYALRIARTASEKVQVSYFTLVVYVKINLF